MITPLLFGAGILAILVLLLSIFSEVVYQFFGRGEKRKLIVLSDDEYRKELDIEIDENDLILFHVDTQLFHRTYLPYVSSVSFYCLYDENKYKIRKNENEIGEIKWVRPLEFINKQIYNSNLLAYRTVEELIKKGVEWKQY